MIELQTAWGWPVALYLFLGGLGGGMFLAATVLGFVRRKRHRRARAVSFWAAFACVAVGLLSLLAEVVLPCRALLVWQSFSHLSSWMALGAWGALAALVLFFATAFLTTKKTSRLLSIVWEAHPGPVSYTHLATMPTVSHATPVTRSKAAASSRAAAMFAPRCGHATLARSVLRAASTRSVAPARPSTPRNQLRCAGACRRPLTRGVSRWPGRSRGWKASSGSEAW